jgi:hypothetical protein
VTVPKPEDWRMCVCPACNGDGGFDIPTGYDPNDGSLTGYFSECVDCSGKGEYLADVSMDEGDWLMKWNEEDA